MYLINVHTQTHHNKDLGAINCIQELTESHSMWLNRSRKQKKALLDSYVSILI